MSVSGEFVPRIVSFTLGDMMFEYDEMKNRKNIARHGISFMNAARVFFDYDRIEFYDEEHSEEEDRYNTIGDISAGTAAIEPADRGIVMIGNVGQSAGMVNDILFVVYTERITTDSAGRRMDVTRLISARLATNFERGIYYGKYS